MANSNATNSQPGGVEVQSQPDPRHGLRHESSHQRQGGKK
jgi:hypothetical protein